MSLKDTCVSETLLEFSEIYWFQKFLKVKEGFFGIVDNPEEIILYFHKALPDPEIHISFSTVRLAMLFLQSVKYVIRSRYTKTLKTYFYSRKSSYHLLTASMS